MKLFILIIFTFSNILFGDYRVLILFNSEDLNESTKFSDIPNIKISKNNVCVIYYAVSGTGDYSKASEKNYLKKKSSNLCNVITGETKNLYIYLNKKNKIAKNSSDENYSFDLSSLPLENPEEVVLDFLEIDEKGNLKVTNNFIPRADTLREWQKKWLKKNGFRAIAIKNIKSLKELSDTGLFSFIYNDLKKYQNRELKKNEDNEWVLTIKDREYNLEKAFFLKDKKDTTAVRIINDENRSDYSEKYKTEIENIKYFLKDYSIKNNTSELREYFAQAENGEKLFLEADSFIEYLKKNSKFYLYVENKRILLTQDISGSDVFNILNGILSNYKSQFEEILEIGADNSYSGDAIKREIIRAKYGFDSNLLKYERRRRYEAWYIMKYIYNNTSLAEPVKILLLKKYPNNKGNKKLTKVWLDDPDVDKYCEKAEYGLSQKIKRYPKIKALFFYNHNSCISPNERLPKKCNGRKFKINEENSNIIVATENISLGDVKESENFEIEYTSKIKLHIDDDFKILKRITRTNTTTNKVDVSYAGINNKNIILIKKDYNNHFKLIISYMEEK